MGNTGFCNTHQDKAGQSASGAETTCYLGGGVDFVSKTVTSALFSREDEAVRMVSRILSRRDRRGGRITKAKDDHRHWCDEEIGVSPHTMKWGIVGKERYPMGKCSIAIREL